MKAYLVAIVCKFGGDPAVCLREEANCAKVYRQTDKQMDRWTDGRLAIALAHSWNELMKKSVIKIPSIDVAGLVNERHLVLKTSAEATNCSNI